MRRTVYFLRRRVASRRFCEETPYLGLGILLVRRPDER
jgi:hypothetical protein